jgi:cytoskeletal protein CcmA (bactofilin family)
MLGSKKSVFSGGGDTTLVSRETEVIGDIHFSGTLEIEGTVKGNIAARPDTDAVVRVVDKGRVEGEIRAPGVVVNGTVVGDVYSTVHLELASKGRVQGNVFYATVEMAAGSEVNGSLTPLQENEPATEKIPDPSVEVSEAGAAGERAAAAPAKVD